MMNFAANEEFRSVESKKHEFEAQSSEFAKEWIFELESSRSVQLQLKERYHLIEQFLKSSKGKTSLDQSELKLLQRKFQAYFGTRLKEMDLKLMIETVVNSRKAKASPHITRPKLRPIKQTKRKMISNKVKLIRLREELKAIKEGKKVEELPIIANAGMVFGWVFWKSIFTSFSWLDDGKFIQTDETNSAIFAANWLHYSVGESESINPLILFICRLEEEQFVRLTEEQLEAEMNGESISNSIEGYYQMILSMWSIFDLEQLPDFIELFVDREGLMQESPVGIKLKLVKEPIDALVNNNPLPWPISMINFSWSTQIIEVEW